MKLTGKCKEEFLDYVFKNNNVLDTSNEVYLNALIIEFFDSVGIYICTVYEFECFESYVNSKCVSVYSESRQEAINTAIEKANIIYNENKL